jgi:hypothetical protein
MVGKGGKRGIQVKELIKKRYEMFCQRQWLKTINKELDAYKKAEKEMKQHKYVLAKLLERYNEIYGENLRIGMQADGGTK